MQTARVSVDKSSATVVITAPFEEVLTVVRDVASQPLWAKEITEAEVLEEYEDGTVATARFTMVSGLGTDTYTLEYEHGPDRMSWVMVDSGVLLGQQGSYVLHDLGMRTEVRLSLEVEHTIKAPGFIRRRVFGKVVSGNAHGLKAFVEARRRS